MATLEASTTISYDEMQSVSLQINDINLSTVATTALNDTEDKHGFCGPFGFQFSLNTIIIGLLCLFGLAGNTISIVVLQKDRHNRVAVFLLQSLAIADNSILCICFILLSIVYGPDQFIQKDSDFLYFTFILLKYINPLANIASSIGIWITVLLAVNRYVAICQPFKAKRWLTMACARVQVAVVVTFCMFLTVPMIFQFRDSPCGNNSSNCSQPEPSDVVTQKWYNIYYTYFYVPFVFIFPLVFLVCLNVPIIRQMQKSKLRMKRNSLAYSGRQETNITVVLVVIILALLVFHTPDRIVLTIRTYEKAKGQSLSPCPEVMFIAMNLTNLLMIANSSTNFIIYYVLRRRFRRILCEKLCCGRGSNPAGSDHSPQPSSTKCGSLYHNHSQRHHPHLLHHLQQHRKSSAEDDIKTIALGDRCRLTKKRDSNQICLLKVNHTCV